MKDYFQLGDGGAPQTAPVLVEVAEDSLINTGSPPEGGYKCNDAHFDTGCLNGYPYNYSTHTPCGVPAGACR